MQAMMETMSQPQDQTANCIGHPPLLSGHRSFIPWPQSQVPYGYPPPWHPQMAIPPPRDPRAHPITESQIGRPTPTRRGGANTSSDHVQRPERPRQTTPPHAKRKTTGEDTDASRDLNHRSPYNPSFAEAADDQRGSEHDDKRTDHRETPQKQALTPRTAPNVTTLTQGTHKGHNPYNRPPPIPTHMVQPPRTFGPQAMQWGSTNLDSYGYIPQAQYPEPTLPMYPPLPYNPPQFQEMDAGSYSQSVVHTMDLADSRPAADARHDPL